MTNVQEHIYFGRLDDEPSPIESLLETTMSVRRWNPHVLGVSESSSATKVWQQQCWSGLTE